MASPQNPATMDDLSEDVLSNIFIRLLAKQLAQMRCLSKSWNTLLSQSSFIKSHLNRSIKNNDPVLLIFNELFPSNKPFTAHPSRSPNRELTNFVKIPIVSPTDFAAGLLIGSFNGLLCFAYKCRIYICNPSLSAVLTLPPFSNRTSGYIIIEMTFRFAFDPRTEDYKVIKLSTFLLPHNADPALADFQNVEIYSMRNRSWKFINQRFPWRVKYLSKQDEVHGDGHDGYLHWLGYVDDERKVQTIITFDLSVERFREIPPPDSIQESDGNRRNYLGTLAGKLCVMSSIEDGGVEVWVSMDRVTASWVKRYVFSQFTGAIIPFGFTLHNEFLFEKLGDCRLSLYDPVSKKVKRFKKRGKCDGLTKVVGYVDSLVWVNPAMCDVSCCNISRLQI
ncbi:hypothetical protein LXL04_018377 [Taraxacum kok-saghyz]